MIFKNLNSIRRLLYIFLNVQLSASFNKIFENSEMRWTVCVLYTKKKKSTRAKTYKMLTISKELLRHSKKIIWALTLHFRVIDLI